MALQIQLATTIDEVVEQLDQIIEWAITQSNRIGYFASLYRNVTVAVRAGIQEGQFEDGARMEQLDVIFANRFLEAFRQYQAQETCTQAWLLAFEQTHRWPPLVLQHLMLGMNAHINLDLGIAAAETMKDKPIENVKADFFTINDILLSLIDDVQTQLAEIFPLLKRLDMVSRFDEIVAEAGIDVARSHAWSVAQTFAACPTTEWEKQIRELDVKVLELGQKILQPSRSFWIKSGLFLLRLGEYYSISKKIELLR